MTRAAMLSAAVLALLVTFAIPAARAGSADVRLTNDDPALGGYVSDYTLVTGQPYTDEVLTTCSQSRGRQNEPGLSRRRNVPRPRRYLARLLPL